MDNITLKQKHGETLPQRDNNTPYGVENVHMASMSLDELVARKDLQYDHRTAASYRYYYKLKAVEHSKKITKDYMERCALLKQAVRDKRSERSGKIYTESGTPTAGYMNMASATVGERNQNIVDYTGEDPSIKQAGVSQHDVGDGGSTQHSLDEFFQRPVTVYDDIIESNQRKLIDLDIWNLWARNPAVRSKLANYAYFKGNLHVKISVSGTPFHYGKLITSYQPYPQYNSNIRGFNKLRLDYPANTFRIDEALRCYLSQAPGIGYIDVKSNEPLILDIPFISHKPKFRLFNNDNDVITGTTDFVDFEEAGRLVIMTLNNIRDASQSIDNDVSINVFAWATEVELGSITATKYEIKTESGVYKGSEENAGLQTTSTPSTQERNFDNTGTTNPSHDDSHLSDIKTTQDEYQDRGPISKMATAVSGVANSLSDVPVIGGFAKATSSMAHKIGSAAGLFGWSKPVVLEKSSFVKNNPFVNGANVEGAETTSKLTIDPKQELSVDPTLGGVDGCDDMSIATIASRESFFTTFQWNNTQAGLTTPIFRCLVNPMTHVGVPMTSTDSVVQPTSLMFATQPFKYWRGKIKYRFEIVCSQFHRGKLLFKYEPNVAQMLTISAGKSQLNQQNGIILDIQNSQELEFTVDWGYVRNWAAVLEPRANVPVYDNFLGTERLSTLDPTTSNGYIEIRALNELVQPSSDTPVLINCYISCDDLQVNRFSSEYLPEGREIVTESGIIINEANDEVDEKICLDHFGEQITSFRAILKRYATCVVMSDVSTVDGKVFHRIRGPSFPRMASHTEFHMPDLVDGKVTRLTLYQYLRYGYMGIRGSMRYRIIGATNDTLGPSDFTKVSLMYETSAENDWDYTIKHLKTTQDATNGFDNNFVTSPDATVIYNHNSNGGIEFEIPYYSSNLFEFSFSPWLGDNYTSEGFTGFEKNWTSRWMAMISSNTDVAHTGIILIDSATGEDFNLLRYQGGAMYTTTRTGPFT